MTDSEKAKIIALRDNGMDLRSIRQLMAMSVADFKKAIEELKQSGELPKRRTGREKVIEAYERGERNPYKIAETYGLSLRTVRTYKQRKGIVTGRSKRNYRHCDRTNAINTDLQLGNGTVAEIARKHGVSWTYVKTLKKKLEEDRKL